MDIPLPEITIEDFHQAWTRFEWWLQRRNGVKTSSWLSFQLEVGGLLYRLGRRKAFRPGALEITQEESRIDDGPTRRCAEVSIPSQKPQERVSDFATDLKKLFGLVYPEGAKSSSVLLWRFLTGLHPEISRHVLLKGRPSSLEKAM